jgi:hypothetical protein
MRKNENYTREKGVALIVVLFIVMIATILSLGFLTRSDSELACGANMVMKTQMDYLAESGLEHAKGRIVSDSNFTGWAVTRQQLYSGNDYYDVNVVSLTVPDPNQPMQVFDYQIVSTGYREKNGQKLGESTLRAELCVDPMSGAFFRRITR